MKKIISGKVYDTETAKALATWRNAGSWRDFGHKEETLFRKKTGEFFLFGEGGPATCYAKATGQNSWTGGSRIMPMSWSEAKDWAEEKLDADDYEEIFGAVTEDDNRIQVCYSLGTATVETIKRRAGALGIAASAYIEQLVAAAEA